MGQRVDHAQIVHSRLSPSALSSSPPNCPEVLAPERRLFIEALEPRVLMTLNVQYFENPGFDNLKSSTSIANVNMPVTSGIPAGSGLASGDTFSARWTGQIQTVSHTGAQTYTFQTNADDGVRLWVNGQLIINRFRPLVFGDPQPLSGTISLDPNTKYDIRVEYMEEAGGAEMVLRWITPGTTTPVIVPAANFFESPGGLYGRYYNDLEFGGSKVPRVDPQVNFTTWGTGAPIGGIGADTFSVRWSGQVRPDHTQAYTFRTVADEGVRLWVDNQLVINNWAHRTGAATTTSPVITLQAGKRYDIQLDYYENTSSASVQLLWSSASQTGGAFQVIPQANLYAGTTTALHATENGSNYGSYTNSVISTDRPDPSVIWTDGWYWSTHTAGGWHGATSGWPLLKSKDLVNWTVHDSALLEPSMVPSWMNGQYWAPDIQKIGNQFVLTSTFRNDIDGDNVEDANDRMGIVLATASSITGPYTLQSSPIVISTATGSANDAIDSHIFKDNNGKVYMTWKQGHTNGSVKLREMNSSGTGWAAGSSVVTILNCDVGGWENFKVEGQWLMKRGNYYYLFYSGNGYGYGGGYAVGVARATSITGPYTRLGSPILQSNGSWVSPGHGGFVTDLNGTTWHLYHAYASGQDTQRLQLLDAVNWGTSMSWPSFNGGTPSAAAQIAPRIVDPSYVFAPVSGAVGGLQGASATAGGGTKTRSSFTRLARDADRTSPFSVRRLFDDIDVNGADEDEREELLLSA